MKKKVSPISIFTFGMLVGIFLASAPYIKTQVEGYQSQDTFTLDKKENRTDNTIMCPTDISLINRSCYSLSYDARTKNPSWVSECLTKENLKGNTDRTNCKFKEDSSIPEIFRATLADYKSSGFDRGHLAPAANHKASLTEMEDTFFLSNMSPQHPQFNRGYWAKLEKYVRDLTKDYERVQVVTGALYLPQEESDGKKYVKYEVIGKNNVAVPTHFFKVLFLEKPSGRIETQAYILPNVPIAANKSLTDFATTLQKVEHVAGILFKK